MQDPLRLRDAGSEASSTLHELLANAGAPRGLEPAAFERGLAGVARTAALPIAFTASWWLSGKAAAWALGVTAALSTAALVVTHETPQPAAAPRPAVTAKARTATPASTIEEPPAPTTQPAMLEEAPAPERARAASPASTLAEEARLLERARAELDARPARALQILREHERRFPHGLLDAEHEVIAVEALVRSGRREEARRRVERALARQPDGLYAERMRRALEP